VTNSNVTDPAQNYRYFVSTQTRDKSRLLSLSREREKRRKRRSVQPLPTSEGHMSNRQAVALFKVANLVMSSHFVGGVRVLVSCFMSANLGFAAELVRSGLLDQSGLG
jgi:hypothetical protein